MGELHKTSGGLCVQNCGLEVLIEDNRTVKVPGDKENPRSQSYVCRKGMNVPPHQHHADPQNVPLKPVDGVFQRISWDPAIDETPENLRVIVEAHGPRSSASAPNVRNRSPQMRASSAWGIRKGRRIGLTGRLANEQNRKEASKMKAKNVVAIVLAVSLLAFVSAGALAQEKTMAFQDSQGMADVLKQYPGQNVVLMLQSGKEIAGKLEKVGAQLVLITKIVGKEFYDAVVRIDQIEGLQLKVRP